MKWISIKDELPEMNVEVIVLNFMGKISFGHIVDKERVVDYNGWNTPGVRYWIPCPTIPADVL